MAEEEDLGLYQLTVIFIVVGLMGSQRDRQTKEHAYEIPSTAECNNYRMDASG